MIAQRFQEEFAKDLRVQLLPVDYVSPLWRDNALWALKSVSPMQLGIGVNDFEALFDKLKSGNHKLSLFEFAICNNLLENQSMKSLELSPETYIKVQHEVAVLAEDWTARTRVIRENVQRRINEQEKLSASLASAGMGQIVAKA